MTMLITKFNKLIANKFVWIGFTFLIVVAFVAWDMAVPEDARDPSGRQAAGTLYGEPVSPDEYRNAYIHTLMALTLSIGQQIPLTEEVNRELEKMAWKRLVSLKTAERMDLRTSDRQIVSAIRSYPGFHHQDQFNPDLYRSFVYQYLPALGFNANQFEEHIRQELVLQQLQRMVAESVLITPAEIQRAVRSLGDEFTVQYVLINEGILGEGLEITDEEVGAFFKENKERFTIPPKVSVKYVRFPIESYKAEVEITESQALDYYDLNIEEFTVYEEAQTDSDEPRNLLFEDDEDEFRIATTQPFEEVQDEIMDRLGRDLAARRAADVAMDYVVKLVPDRQGLAATFEEAAETYELEIKRTASFARGEIPDGIDAGVRFSVAAFDLRPHPEYYFSDAVEGRDYIYVLALEERFPSYVPELEEVEEQVREVARRETVANAVKEFARAFQEAATQELRAGRSFAQAAEAFAIPVDAPISFTASGGMEDVPYGGDLLRAVLAHNEGEVTSPAETEEGYLVAFIARREAADMSQYADFQRQIVSSLARERTRILFEEWQDHLLKKADFTPRIVEPRRLDDEDDFDDDWVQAR